MFCSGHVPHTLATAVANLLLMIRLYPILKGYFIVFTSWTSHNSMSKTPQKPSLHGDLSTTIMGRKGEEGDGLHEEIGTHAVPQQHSVASIFAAASEFLSLNTNTNNKAAGIEQEKSQYSGTCDIVDAPGDTPSVSVDEFLHEEQMQPPARQTADTESPRGTVEKGKLPVARKHELQKPKVQKDHVQVDGALFQALPSDARRFLPTQGISTPEGFLDTNTATITNALMNWRIKNRYDLSECSFINAQYCIYKWKSKMRGHLAFLEASQAVTAATTAPATVCFNETLCHLDEELSNLSSLARQFLPSQGITTAKALLATGTKATAEALMKWRTKSAHGECSIKDCCRAVLQWKRDVYEGRHNTSGQELRTVGADLNHFSLMTRRFLSSQGIMNAAALRSAEIDMLANALKRWRERQKMPPLALGAARIRILKWKKEHLLPNKSKKRKPSESQKRKSSNSKKEKPSESQKQQQQQHSSLSPGERQPKALLAVLDQAFHILSTPVQSFFVEQLILTPVLLLQRDRQELARAFVEWRDRSGTRELKLGTAMSYVSEWRQISFAKVKAPPSCQNGVTTLAARNDSDSGNGAQLREDEGSIMRPGFGVGIESRSTQGIRASSHDDTATIRNDLDNVNQRKHPPTEAILDTTTDKPVPQVRVQMDRSIADPGTVVLTLPLQADAVETTNLHLAWAHAHAQPAHEGSATDSSLDDESETTATQKMVDNRFPCEQPVNAAALDVSGEPHELSNDGNCYLSFLERDAIRYLASRGITTSKSLLEANSKELAHALMEARRGSTTFSSSYSSSYQHVYRWKRIVRQRQAADCDHLSLNMLPPADQQLLASVGITTATAFLNMKPAMLAHALIESRQQLNMKPWAFSTARQVIYNWLAVVRPKESIPIPARELLAEEPEERPFGLDPIFKNLSPSDQWFLFAQSIMTAHDLIKVGTQELARHLTEWKRDKTRRDFKMSSATIYILRWKGLARSHVEGRETVALSSNADDTASTSTGSGQHGTTTATSSVGNIKEREFYGTVHQQRNDVDCMSDESLCTTNGSAKSTHHATYSPHNATKIAIYRTETRYNHTNGIIDTQAPTDAIENGQSELRTNGKLRHKVTKRSWVQLTQARTVAASVDEGEDSSIYYSHDDEDVQVVNSLAGTEHAECADSWAHRKRPRTENAPNDFKPTGISSIAPFVTNMKTFSYW
jgi:hypothetical protein